MFIVGLIFGVVSWVLASFGYVFQRKGQLQAMETGTSILRNCSWLFGQTIALLRTPVYMVALSMTSQISLSVIPIFSIYMIILSSWIVLNTQLTRYDVYPLIFFTPGMVIIIIASHVKQPDIKSKDLNEYIFSTGSIWLLILAFIILVTIGFFVYRIIHNFEMIKRHIEALNFSEQQAFEQSDASSTKSADPIIPEVHVMSYRWGLIPMIYFPFVSALFGTLSNTVAKWLLIVYRDDIHHHDSGNQNMGVAYVIVLGVLNLLFMVLNLYFLNKWFRYFEPIHIIPLERTSNLICNILCGGIVYKEFKEYDYLRTCGIFLGCGFCIIGAAVFMSQKDKEYQEKDFLRDEVISQASFSTISEDSVKGLITLK